MDSSEPQGPSQKRQGIALGGLRKNWKKALAISLVVLLIITAVLVALVLMDVAGNSATESQTLEPPGATVGKALVVYNPGLSGQPRDVAMTLGHQLVAEGYAVMVAGVNNEAAANITGYDVIIVGSPNYGGKASSTIEEYLKAFSPTEQVKLGVFTTTGGSGYDQNAFDAFTDYVASLIGSKSLIIDTDIRFVLTVGVEEDCREMVQNLLA